MCGRQPLKSFTWSFLEDFVSDVFYGKVSVFCAGLFLWINPFSVNVCNS